MSEHAQYRGRDVGAESFLRFDLDNTSLFEGRFRYRRAGPLEFGERRADFLLDDGDAERE